MSNKLDLAYVEQLKQDAWENIESYQDPETPDALSSYTNQMKKALLADPSMLASLPEYLPVALFGNVRFPEQVHQKWKSWLADNTLPTWDEFKVSIAFNNEDIPLVKAAKEQSLTLLIQSCAVLFMLMIDDTVSQTDESDFDEYENESDDYSDQYDTNEDY
ncbi:hypothetical protein SOPP22_15385 [Shewanella sp. OPT22]|nr:hypothetical protein SOPP22_15385 [Shewanella sp. OPT22]